MNKQTYPPGWKEERVRQVIAHYDNQTEEEQAAEIEAARTAENQTMMSVPTELVPAIARLIEVHARRNQTVEPPSVRPPSPRPHDDARPRRPKWCGCHVVCEYRTPR